MALVLDHCPSRRAHHAKLHTLAAALAVVSVGVTGASAQGAASPQRADVMASVARPVNANATVYMSVGRSLSSLEEGGTSLAPSGGLSLRFSAPRATP